MKHLVWKTSVLLILFILIFQTEYIVHAADQDEEQPSPEDEILDDISLNEVNQYWNKIIHDYGGYIPDLNKSSLYELIKEKESLSIKNIFYGTLDFLFHELLANGKLLGMLLILTLCSTVLQTMHAAFERGTISKIAYFVVYIVLLFLALNSFYAASSYAKETIEMMNHFMLALIPLVL